MSCCFSIGVEREERTARKDEVERLEEHREAQTTVTRTANDGSPSVVKVC